MGTLGSLGTSSGTSLLARAGRQPPLPVLPRRLSVPFPAGFAFYIVISQQVAVKCVVPTEPVQEDDLLTGAGGWMDVVSNLLSSSSGCLAACPRGCVVVHGAAGR